MMIKNPIPGFVSLSGLAAICKSESEQGRRIVHCHGCFDVLHIGHIRHLRDALKFGDFLVVTITPDRFVGKGEGRPVFNETERAEMLSVIDSVQLVAINDKQDAADAIRLIRPDFFVKGCDYLAGIAESERLAAEEVGAAICITSSPKFSTTDLIKRLRNVG